MQGKALHPVVPLRGQTQPTCLLELQTELGTLESHRFSIRSVDLHLVCAQLLEFPGCHGVPSHRSNQERAGSP